MALIYSAELLHRNEFKKYKQHLKSSEFIERKMPIYLNALEHSFSKIIGITFPIITSNTNHHLYRFEFGLYSIFEKSNLCSKFTDN